MNRQQICDYLKQQKGTQHECLWKSQPNHYVFRHQKNQKWYALIIGITKDKLGFKSTEMVDILNVKCMPESVYLLRQQNGILPAYHMNKEHWVSILLDGSVSAEIIIELLEASYQLTQ